MTPMGPILLVSLSVALHATVASAQAPPDARTINSCSMRAFPQDSAAPFCIPGPDCVTNNVLGMPPAEDVELSGRFGSFNHDCSAAVDMMGPAASVSVSLVEVVPDVGDIALNNGHSEVQYYVRINGAGAPGNIPITVDTLLTTNVGLTNAIARLDMRVANSQKLTAQVRTATPTSCSFIIEDEARFESGLLAAGACVMNLTGPTALRGDAEPGVSYLVTLTARAELRDPGEIFAISGPFIQVDPDAEFATGQRYADFYTVQLSSGVVQLPEPASFLYHGLSLACLVVMRRRRS